MARLLGLAISGWLLCTVARGADKGFEARAARFAHARRGEIITRTGYGRNLAEGKAATNSISYSNDDIADLCGENRGNG